MWETWFRSLRSGRDPGEGNGNPLQYLCLQNSRDWIPGTEELGNLQSMGLDSPFFLNFWKYSIVWMHHTVFIYLLSERYLGCLKLTVSSFYAHYLWKRNLGGWMESSSSRAAAWATFHLKNPFDIIKKLISNPVSSYVSNLSQFTNGQ